MSDWQKSAFRVSATVVVGLLLTTLANVIHANVEGTSEFGAGVFVGVGSTWFYTILLREMPDAKRA